MHNFKNALALYEYISDFKGDGFTSKEVVNNLNEVRTEASSDAVRIDEIASFLTLQYTENLTKELKESYEEYKSQESILLNEKEIESLKTLKKRLEVEEITPYDYILKLEELNKSLTLEHQDYVDIKNKFKEALEENEKLNTKNEALNQEILSLNLSLDKKRDELEALNQKYIDDMEARKVYYEGEINKIQAEHQEEIRSLNLKHELDVDTIKKDYQAQIDKLEAGINDRVEEIIKEYDKKANDLETNYTIELDHINFSHQNEINDLNLKLNEATSQIDTYKDERDNALLKCEEDIKNSQVLCDDKIAKNNEKTEYELNLMKEELNLAKARVLAIEAKYKEKTISDDFTSKEDFEALELQYQAFKKLFKGQWKKTKKKIRKEFFWTKKNDDKK